MKTRLTRSVRVAAEFIRSGEIVAFPTETVYGLGADIFNESSIRKVFAAKGRAADNPLIAHISELNQIRNLTSGIPHIAEKLIEAFFPGPLTLVLPKAAPVPLIATAGLETIAIRMPRHDLALELIREGQTPLVAPSANLSGKPSPTTWQAVKTDLDGLISCILQGGPTDLGLESTVVDCTGEFPIVLRTGAITLEALRAVTPQITLGSGDTSVEIRSPGLKYRHYAPAARVQIVESPAEARAGKTAAYIGLNAEVNGESFRLHCACASLEEYAHNLYRFFRACDEAGVEVIYCEALDNAGLGLAIMDRLRRASYRE